MHPETNRNGGQNRPRRTTTTTIPAQLRRRRDAAHRCEPLESGHRDPLDLTTTRHASITTDTARSLALVKGYDVAHVLRSARLRCRYSAAGRGWLIALHDVPEADAQLTWAGYDVLCRERQAVA
jgi:hypothetical protein